MTNNNSPEKTYKTNLNLYKNLYAQQVKSFKLVSTIRLIVFIVFASIFYLFYRFEMYFVMSALLLLFFITFIILIKIHSSITNQKKLYQQLIKINNQSIDRVNFKWTEFIDTGKEYINYDHEYSNDLDLFGTGSLFQWINVTNTYSGRTKLKNILTQLPFSKNEILARQESITELSNKNEFRQKLQAIGLEIDHKKSNPADLLSWAEDNNFIISSLLSKNLLRVTPIISICFILFCLISNFLPASFAFLPILLQLIVFQFKKSQLSKVMQLATYYKDMIKTYKKILDLLNTENFECNYLNEIKSKLISKNNIDATSQINKLESIIDYMGLRHSNLHYIINGFTLWDYQCVIALENWKKNCGNKLNIWLDIIAEFETLSSLSLLHFDNPDWNFPEISDKKYSLTANNLGHPLLNKNSRVTNNVSFNGAGNIHLITGSNMSGKSTLLRTVGINLILAYLGAPVCAENFNCSLMKIYSSMRISDNLEKHISSFYAELIRVKMIIDASKNTAPMIFLLDEVFRGTNSRDRKIGAQTIIENLTSNKVIGMVSTHDLELTGLKSDNNLCIDTYYFKENYKDGKINFDYKMREGISDTSDAIYLMKMVGLDVKP